jgi:hypothetical protein
VTSRKEGEDAARSLFPGVEAGTILLLLDEYGVHDWEPARERVQLAILKLSNGDEARLLHTISVAKEDYRDVLMWADNPVTPEKAAEQRKLDNEILKNWGDPGASDA